MMTLPSCGVVNLKLHTRRFATSAYNEQDSKCVNLCRDKDIEVDLDCGKVFMVQIKMLLTLS